MQRNDVGSGSAAVGGRTAAEYALDVLLTDVETAAEYALVTSYGGSGTAEVPLCQPWVRHSAQRG